MMAISKSGRILRTSSQKFTTDAAYTTQGILAENAVNGLLFVAFEV
jgi:hypothetical protein